MRAHLDIEISVLRTIMVADSNAKALLTRLTQEHFTCPELAQIFVAIEAMYEKAGRVPDHQTIMNADQFQEMSGFPLIEDPDEVIPSRQPLQTKNQIKYVLHEMDANIAVKGMEEKILPVLDKLSRDLPNMIADATSATGIGWTEDGPEPSNGLALNPGKATPRRLCGVRILPAR